jgi:putative FmdB family regulatory protein
MPTYAYRCESCEHEFDEFQSIKADPIKVCPKCKRHKVRRLIGTGAAVLFKGSGFYETDYRSKTYAEAAKADTPSSSTASSTSAGSNNASTGASGSANGKPGGTDGSNGSTGKAAGTSDSTGSAGSNGSGK